MSGKTYELAPEKRPITAFFPPIQIHARQTKEWNVPVNLTRDVNSGQYPYMASLPSGLERRSLWEVVDFA
jgi:hypothetical protein